MDDADGTDHLVTFTVDAAFVPGDSETDTIAAAANQIYDLADNAAGTSTVTISVPNTAPSFAGRRQRGWHIHLGQLQRR